MTTKDEILKYLAESPHTTNEISVHIGSSFMNDLRILELAKQVKYRADKGLWYLNKDSTNA